jgi:hypothetical protein
MPTSAPDALSQREKTSGVWDFLESKKATKKPKWQTTMLVAELSRCLCQQLLTMTLRRLSVIALHSASSTYQKGF